MRKLHPVGPHEVLRREGRFRRPDGAVESFSIHALPGARQCVRAEVPGAELWHLTLDEVGQPERLELRLNGGGRTLEATYTFFPDEALVWRRGGEPASEALALPPGYRLLWPPAAGRELCLAGVGDIDGAPGAIMCALLRLRPQDPGGVGLRPVKFTARRVGGGLYLTTPGLPEASAELDGAGWLRRWQAGGETWEALEAS